MKVGDTVIAKTSESDDFEGVCLIELCVPGDRLIVRRIMRGGIEVSKPRKVQATFVLHEGEYDEIPSA